MRGFGALAAAAVLLGITAGALAQRPPSDEERERNRVRLGITREQQEQIEALYAELDRQNREIWTRSGELFRQLDEKYSSYDLDQEGARAIRRELMGLHRRRLMAFAEFQDKLRRVLNREQFNRLQVLVREQREKWRKQWEQGRGRGGPGGGRPGGHPGPPPPP